MEEFKNYTETTLANEELYQCCRSNEKPYLIKYIVLDVHRIQKELDIIKNVICYPPEMKEDSKDPATSLQEFSTLSKTKYHTEYITRICALLIDNIRRLERELIYDEEYENVN